MSCDHSALSLTSVLASRPYIKRNACFEPQLMQKKILLDCIDFIYLFLICTAGQEC